MSKHSSVSATSINASSIDIARTYQQLQRLRKLIAQAEHSDKTRHARTRAIRHGATGRPAGRRTG
jgi:uncharacterized membrane protein